MTAPTSLPVVILGAGPVGLAAAAHTLARGLQPLVLEAGPRVGAAMLRWSHVRMFSPWRYNIDRASANLLERQGWTAPEPDALPTGRDVVERYLEPLAATPELRTSIRLGARAVAVTRLDRDRMKNAGRDESPFVVRYAEGGEEREVLARAVIDATGTLHRPGPLGASGIAALGERALDARIAYGIPDVLGDDRHRYAGRRVLVVGSGHSAFNVLTDLAALAREAAGTAILWAIRRPALGRALGGGANDQLPERGRLGSHVQELLEGGAIELVTGFAIERLEPTPAGILAHGAGGRRVGPVDEIIAATGFRPEPTLLSELRLDLDPATESPRALAPLIDPNVHSCGTVPPHGADELRHPDANVFVVGMKSYGRAPTFLLLTGYEQVRSVVSAIAGDWEGARRVELQLPESGVCGVDTFDDATVAAGCCGGPPPPDTPVSIGACCARDAAVKSAGRDGCGC